MVRERNRVKRVKRVTLGRNENEQRWMKRRLTRSGKTSSLVFSTSFPYTLWSVYEGLNNRTLDDEDAFDQIELLLR